MKATLKTLTVSTALFAAQSVSAYDTCIRTQTLDLRHTIEKMSSCEAVQPLKLAQKSAYYTYLKDSPYFVRYWEGSFKKSFKIRVSYRTFMYDYCNAKVILNEKESRIYPKQTVYFEVENPNLNSNLMSTIELAPLTQAEADAALVKTMKDCEDYSPL